MGMNDTPVANRVHIGFFGRRNVGKSSLVNRVTGQNLSIVSDTKGTTTDPVRKTMELLPLGPVLIIDTPGYDDEGALGRLRVEKTRQMLRQTDVAVLVADAAQGLGKWEQELLNLFRERSQPYIIAYNKADIVPDHSPAGEHEIYISALTGDGIQELKEKIAHVTHTDDMTKQLVGDLMGPEDVAVLVTPIDSAAPKGRMILPQQQVIRDVLETEGICVVVREDQLTAALASLSKKPALVVTDSQAFHQVNAQTPQDIPLTSFSILMARFKGTLEESVRAVAQIERLEDGDKVLIAEGCTHHRQCTDIGTVKLPNWLQKHTGKHITIETSSGTEFPDDLTPYKLVLHCGGCMLNEREMQYRQRSARLQGVPMTNYGIAIAYMNSILKRSIALFPDLLRLLEGREEA